MKSKFQFNEDRLPVKIWAITLISWSLHDNEELSCLAFTDTLKFTLDDYVLLVHSVKDSDRAAEIHTLLVTSDMTHDWKFCKKIILTGLNKGQQRVQYISWDLFFFVSVFVSAAYTLS